MRGAVWSAAPTWHPGPPFRGWRPPISHRRLSARGRSVRALVSTSLRADRPARSLPKLPTSVQEGKGAGGVGRPWLPHSSCPLDLPVPRARLAPMSRKGDSYQSGSRHRVGAAPTIRRTAAVLRALLLGPLGNSAAGVRLSAGSQIARNGSQTRVGSLTLHQHTVCWRQFRYWCFELES